jgi:hypothetical protein
VVLAAFTYTSGLRAPASIAIVKDLLVYITVIALIVIVPIKVGGFGHIFAAIPKSKMLLPSVKDGNTGLMSFYGTLAFGSALALMLYPHATTAALAAKGPKTLRFNLVFLPAYSFMLGLIALLGYVAYVSGISTGFGPLFQAVWASVRNAGPLASLFSWLVRRSRFRGSGYRCTGSGCHYVHCGRQSFYPEHLQTVFQSTLFCAKRNPYRQVNVTGRQIWGPAVYRFPATNLRNSAAVARGCAHPANLSSHCFRYLHALV